MLHVQALKEVADFQKKKSDLLSCLGGEKCVLHSGAKFPSELVLSLAHEMLVAHIHTQHMQLTAIWVNC